MSRRQKFWILAPFLFGAALFFFGWIVMLLWNAILPAVLGVKALTFWQGLGLLVLCRLLFGGLGSRGMHRQKRGGKWGKDWSHLNDAEREKLRAAWQERCRRKNDSAEKNEEGLK